MRLHKLKIFIWLLLFLLIPEVVPSQQMDIPARIQVATLSKIFKYVPSLRAKNPVKLLLVYDKKTKSDKENFVTAFENASVEVKAVLPDEIENIISGYDVVYFMPGLQDHAELCKKHKKLSNAGVAKYAQNGEVSIALGLENDKPRLFINMSSLKNEGIHLSANLLKIAKVFP